MKKLLGIIAASAMTASVFAQGTVQLFNQTGLVKQWTSAQNSALVSLTKGAGSVELIAAPTGTAYANALGTLSSSGFTANYQTLSSFLGANPGWAVPVGTANPALVNTANGIFNNGVVSINNIAEAATAQYLIIGWSGSYATLDAALAADNAGDGTASFIGISALTTTTTGDPLATPAGSPVILKTTFAGMTLAPVVVPEPTSFALAGLGLAALVAFRRRS